MTYARKSLICLRETPHYHVIARCVRRSWLCGVDPYLGKDYSHRKGWVISRLRQLAAIFAIDICAYAVMANHYHLVLHVDQDRARTWSKQKVVELWTALFSKPLVIDRWQQGLCEEAECKTAEALIEQWRQRLRDVSWYMRCLNEHLARRANEEDDCTGRFWEGRFKSQALLDDPGLLTAMAYVDLNPIRAGVATNLEDSEFTSIRSRIDELGTRPLGTAAETLTKIPLQAFRDQAPDDTPTIPFSLRDYLELLRWTQQKRLKEVHTGGRKCPGIMQQLKVNSAAWNSIMQPGGNAFGRALGRLDRLRAHAKALGQSWVCGLQKASETFA